MNKKGTLLAVAVGVLFTSATFANATAVEPAQGTVKCTGVNACKGKSECKTATSACKGANSCKGKGVISMMTEKECTDKGGVVQKD